MSELHDDLRYRINMRLSRGGELSAYQLKKELGILTSRAESQAIYYVLRRMVFAGDVVCREVQAQHFHNYRGKVSKVYRAPGTPPQPKGLAL